MPTNLLFIVQSVNAIGMLLVAIGVGIISYRQYYVQREEHRLSLFDRRFELFRVQQKFLSSILAHARVDDDTLGPYIDGMQKSTFLLDDEMHAYIESIYRRAIHFQGLQAQIRGLQGEERSRKIDQEHRELLWLTNQLLILIQRYKKFLGMKM